MPKLPHKEFLKVRKLGKPPEYIRISAIQAACPAPIIGAADGRIGTELWLKGPGPVVIDTPPDDIYFILDQYGTLDLEGPKDAAA